MSLLLLFGAGAGGGAPAGGGVSRTSLGLAVRIGCVLIALMLGG